MALAVAFSRSMAAHHKAGTTQFLSLAFAFLAVWSYSGIQALSYSVFSFLCWTFEGYFYCIFGRNDIIKKAKTPERVFKKFLDSTSV